LFILPESLPKARRSRSNGRAPSDRRAAIPARERTLAGLSLVNFFASSPMSCCPRVRALCHYRYGWDTGTVGATLALVGLCGMIVQGAAIGPIVQHLGERKALPRPDLRRSRLCIFGAAPSGRCSGSGIP